MSDIVELASGLMFPEGPVAMKDGSVAFVELAAGAIRKVTPDGRNVLVAKTGGGANGLAVGPDGAFYVCNSGGSEWTVEEDGRYRSTGLMKGYKSGSIQRVDPSTGAVTLLYDRCGDHLLSGPNDLVFDKAGGFYFTDFGRVRGRVRDIGSVYYALPDGSHIAEIIHPIPAPNGVGLSPDGKTLYVAETDTARLWSWPVLEPGKIGKLPFPSPHGGKLVAGVGGFQRFDSLAVQANGDICVATLINGGITVISPDGGRVRHVPIADVYTTNICFGGPDLKTAYVTAAATNKLLAMPWAEPGLRLEYEA